MTSFVGRMIGAARLDTTIYEEVERDPQATTQALAVVALSSLAAGIGALASGEALRVVAMTVAALLGWIVWAALIYLIGAKMLPEAGTRANVGELLRTIGFASSPGLLRIIGIVPLLGGLLSFLISIWVLVATVVAVRQALDYRSTGRAVAVCLIGWVVYVVVWFVFSAVFGVGAMLTGAAAR